MDERSIPSPEPEPMPEWQEGIDAGMDNLIENFELFYEPDENGVFSPLGIDPEVLTDGEDVRLVADLSEREREHLATTLKQKVGVHDASRILRTYTFANPEPTHTSDQGHWRGEAEVRVYETAFSEEQGIFLHEVRRPGYPPEFFLAGPDYIFAVTE